MLIGCRGRGGRAQRRDGSIRQRTWEGYQLTIRAPDPEKLRQWLWRCLDIIVDHGHEEDIQLPEAWVPARYPGRSGEEEASAPHASTSQANRGVLCER